MATTLASDFQIYDEYFHLGQTEVIRQNVNTFNAASGGALRIVPRDLQGDFAHESFFKEFVTDSRRDNEADTDVASTKMADDEIVSVKLNRRQGPHQYSIDAFKKKGMSAEQASLVIGRQSQMKKFQRYLNGTLTALVPALETAGVRQDSTADDDISFSALSAARAVFGDAYQDLVALVMHGDKFHALVDDAITNYKIENVAGTTIATGAIPGALGLPVIVTDSSALITTDGVSTGVDEYHTVLLGTNAATIEESEEQTMADEVITGKENITREWQLEYAYNLSLKGFKWDTTNGGRNPADSALGTGTNWDKAVTDDKSLAGVLLDTK